MSLMLVLRRKVTGSVGKGTVCLGILVNPSELCKYMNVCVGGGGWVWSVCVCVYKRRTAEWVRPQGKIRLKKRIQIPWGISGSIVD